VRLCVVVGPCCLFLFCFSFMRSESKCACALVLVHAASVCVCVCVCMCVYVCVCAVMSPPHLSLTPTTPPINHLPLTPLIPPVISTLTLLTCPLNHSPPTHSHTNLPCTAATRRPACTSTGAIKSTYILYIIYYILYIIYSILYIIYYNILYIILYVISNLPSGVSRKTPYTSSAAQRPPSPLPPSPPLRAARPREHSEPPPRHHRDRDGTGSHAI